MLADLGDRGVALRPSTVPGTVGQHNNNLDLLYNKSLLLHWGIKCERFVPEAFVVKCMEVDGGPGETVKAVTLHVY